MPEKLWPMWSVSYQLDGQRWAIDLRAKDAADAKRRLAAAAHFGTVDGQLVASLPAGFGPVARAICWVRNTFARPNRPASPATGAD